MEKTIVILANSVKHKNHCVAGKCVETKEWIRPVSNKEGKELTSEEVEYNNCYGSQKCVKPLQKIKMKLESKESLINQPENYLIDKETKWEQTSKINNDDLKDFLDKPDDLWGETDKVSFNDIKNKKIEIDNSLYLIELESLKLYKNFYEDDEGNKKYKRRVSFKYNNIDYDFPVTDPKFNLLLEKEDNKTLENKKLCVSLGEEFKGNCYKIAAAIL